MPTHHHTEAATTVFATDAATNRTNLIRDALAGILVVAGLLLPWSVSCGVGIAGTPGWVFSLLALVTVLSLAAVVCSHVGTGAARDRLRLLLNVPYLLVTVGFVAVTVVQSVSYGGTGTLPPGIGPGAWLGTAGALLAAQPSIAGTDDEWFGARTSRIIGVASVVLAIGAVAFNLYWRTRFVVPQIGNADTGMQNLIVAVAALFYGLVALAPIVIAARWLMSGTAAARMATVLLGSSVLISGALVWILPVGRDLDAFHGIAQNTSTAGVGFEGYLAWAAAAALVGTATVLGASVSGDQWRGSTRKCLLIIAVWCGGSAVLRIIDLMSTSVLDLPAPPYNSTALMAFDLVVAVLAMWLFINHNSSSAAPRLVMPLLFGILFVLTVSRVIVGVALVPRVQPLNASDINSVYGNTLSQQITSTFDVALCVLALALLVIPLVAGATSGRIRNFEQPVAAAEPPEPVAVESATIRIARPQTPSTATDSAHDRVAQVLAESTKRFAAGTTYGGAQRADD
ncbi:DUF7937 domain-containing protein [Mycobacterium dioxanotrophicus]|uniref:DUF7937 domain-containing protein n=1 Tax=Mycobacterium dioxanotrophicus TaxID=482462 RepID=UPI001E61ECE9|nr:hypothetical protein [Mycobacterium dioxanotrophicus]